jgi:flagellar hook-associated protein 1 FlgK
MTIGSILSNALTGLNASQTALGVISQNVSNANTAGYVRAQINFSPQVIAGAGAGVSVEAVTRAADRFLAEAQRVAGAAGASASARADLLDRAQALFGDPNGEQTVFTRIDDVFTALQSAALDPASTVARRNVLSSMQDVFSEFSRIAEGMEALRLEADQRAGEAVARADSLLQRISELNGQIALTRKSSGDSSGAENARDQLIDELTTLLDVRVTPKADGAVELRTNTGALLVGFSAARLEYAQYASAYGPPGTIIINKGQPTEGDFGPMMSGGLIRALMQARDVDFPNLSESVSALASAMADALNQAQTAGAGNPPASRLEGRNTGLLATDALNFTGSTVIAVTDANGLLQRRITVNFNAGTITTENPADSRTFTQTVGGLTSALNAVLQLSPAQGTATFSNGVLALDTGSTSGLVVDGGGSRAGRGFSHYFGLNDLIRSDRPYFDAAGISGTDAHGLVAGGVTRFRVADSAGRIVVERDITVTGTTWNDYLAALNNTTTGIGQFGTASIDALGNVVINGTAGHAITALSDTTVRGTTGLGVTDLFVMSRGSLASRPHELRVNADLLENPALLAFGRPDMTAAIGTRIAEGGDSRGAQALLGVRDTGRQFAAAGTMPAQTTTFGLYASRLAGEAARLADTAAKTETGAQAVLKAATERRSQAEGVSIDEELVRMTQFQQSYAAASRLIQAAKEMIDTLLSIK